VVVPVPREPATIVSVPAAVRAATNLAGLEDVERIVFWTEAGALPKSWRRYLTALSRPWTHVAAAGGSRSLAQALEPGSPVLVVAPDTVPEPQELRDLLARPIGEQPPTAWIWRGVPVAAYYSEPLMLLAHVERESEVFPHLKLLDAGTPRIEVAAERWNDASDVAGARVAERRLLGSLRRPSDGYLARFDRVLSVALSRALARTPITPHVITPLSLRLDSSVSTNAWRAGTTSISAWFSPRCRAWNGSCGRWPRVPTSTGSACGAGLVPPVRDDASLEGPGVARGAWLGRAVVANRPERGEGIVAPCRMGYGARAEPGGRRARAQRLRVALR